MKRVLLTGGSGFIGGHCLKALLIRGFQVLALSFGAASDAIPDSMERRVNLLQPGASRAFLRDYRPTHLLHLAWQPTTTRGWQTAPADDHAPWVDASLHLVREFHEQGGERVVVAGSCAEYDWSGGICRETTTRIAPVTAYGLAKHAFHLKLQDYCRSSGLSHAWARIFFCYGPNEHPDRLMPSVIRSLLDGKPALCSHGRQVRDYLYATDLADALVRLLEIPARGTFNVASGKPAEIRDVVTRIATKLGRLDLVRFGALPPGPLDGLRAVADVRRMKRIAHWQAAYDLDRGLDETIAWWAGSRPVRPAFSGKRTVSHRTVAASRSAVTL